MVRFILLVVLSSSALGQAFEWQGTKCSTIDSCTDRRFNNYFNESRRMRNEFQNRVYGRNSYRWDREVAVEANRVHRINRDVRVTGGSGSKIKWHRTK